MWTTPSAPSSIASGAPSPSTSSASAASGAACAEPVASAHAAAARDATRRIASGVPGAIRQAYARGKRMLVFAPSDYDFELPPELVAQEPAAARDASRLLHLAPDGGVTDHRFSELAALLPAGAVVIANDTRVIPARVRGHKHSGGGIELLFLESEPSTSAPVGTSAWRCLARARRPLRPGQMIEIDGGPTLEILTERAADGTVAVAAPGDGLA